MNIIERTIALQKILKAVNADKNEDTIDIIRRLIVDLSVYKDLDVGGQFLSVTNAEGGFDAGTNDVVLTPTYVAEFMCKLCDIKQDDVVCDYCAGTGGLLLAATRYTANVHGCEYNKKLAEIAALSVDVTCSDAINFDIGPYDVLLMNPPYSADGKGFVYVEKAMRNLREDGRAAILIQENAGSGQGLPYTEKILKRHALVASIHMSDIFKGKAGVQTAIYVFGPLPQKEVFFIDMTDDGITRSARKKASPDKLLVNKDHAIERYAEAVGIIKGTVMEPKYYEVIRDTITDKGDDWTVSQHKQIDTIPTFFDFYETVCEYMDWKIKSEARRRNFAREEKVLSEVQKEHPEVRDFEHAKKYISAEMWFSTMH